ncbi:hypothetical protein E4U42_004653 [Claviceps africana]|uniref:Homeobox domain-containing protein n=1 Tax=Claviceps africana TaxID=83212 RepID=A0A8K0J7P6_9HYPO|nr:hypothetical protein E4U42_004653 [Claviceps africana]
MALPSIRQTFPDLHLETSLANVTPGVPAFYHSPEAPRSAVALPYRERPPLPARDYWTGNPEYGAGSSALIHPVDFGSRCGPRHDCSSPPPTLKSDRHHPSHYSSFSSSSIIPHDHNTLTSSAYGYHYQDMGQYIDTGTGGDSKQRKRRGNLPKETTDLLRSWFVAHLQHPYPTEDEKQELMRQTGLQMNQISNWFINARRRQLPTMINNARAESDVMTARSHGGHGIVLKSTEEHTPEHGGRRDDGFPLSDSEGGAYEDEIHPLHQRRVGNLERESI